MAPRHGLRFDGGAAVVTGASSGFGVEFAQRLAARGADLVLVARRLDRLEAIAARLTRDHGVTATPVALDLTRPEAPAELAERLADAPVRALVNNAGFGTYGPFVEEDPARIADEVALNVGAVTQLSRLFLPRLLAAPSGLLVNLTSTAAYQPIPRIAVYAATKAYVRALTEALWEETRGTPVRVVALAPGPSRTEFFEAAGSEGFAIGQMLPPAAVVDTLFRHLERGGRAPSVVAGWRNGVSAAAAGLLPRRFVVRTVGRLTSRYSG